ncbi:MAG TPA: hypothetical protein VLK58_13460 [Conexibacter sp.]|nr:hypothetical protein [Conexibacter sp.]
MARLTFPEIGSAHSLGVELEQQRLAHRAARIRRTLAAMRQLAETKRDEVPVALRLGMTDFDRELTRVEQRLRELSREPLL